MPQIRYLTTLLVSLTASALALAALATPSSASPLATGIVGGPTVIVTPVETTSSPELDNYLATLSSADRDEFVRTQIPAEQTLTLSAPVRQSSTRVLGGESALSLSTVSPLATGCWTQRWSGSAKAAAGNTLYTYYTTGGWCSSGSTITSAWVAAAGGETSTPGWRYSGVIASGAGIVSNQGRSYSQEQFVLSVGGWDVQTASPCVRVLGKTTGGSSAQYSCGLS